MLNFILQKQKSDEWCENLFKVNSSHPGQNVRHFEEKILKWIFLNENGRIPIKISLKFIPKSPIDNKPALF